MSSVLQPGLLVLHGNRLELLRDAVFDWLQRNPLEPLEEEVFLVQSNGAGEWLKMSLARAAGICAATRVELPGRFLWKTSRRVLGADRVPPQSSLEKEAITWRLMRLLPTLLDRADFEPVASFLASDDADRRLQLARHLADLYDQYQVYRTDWLADWEHGRPRLSAAPVPSDQRWQVALWRALLDELSRDERASARPDVHRALIGALASDRPPVEPLPRRIVLFGAAYLPVQSLEALAALASRVQVILAVPNPCRYHWADIIDGREALRTLQTVRQRMPSIASVDLSAEPLGAMHLHAHPLLAAWGRQGRDFMRQLDGFDDAAEARERFDLPRIDLFDDGPGTTLLAQVQASIRDLVPLHDHPARVADRADRSIVFHVAHGAQREVEILHDQLLSMLAGPDGLRPRDVIVMVPDIERFAPSIRAVFGQYPHGDARHIPFDIADLRSRGSNPLVVAVEWLLGIAERRIGLHELRDLVDVPAVARRLGLDDDAVPGLFAWLAGAGVRWGLHEAHRDRLGLGAAGEQNTWLFGMRRLLLGFAIGRDTGSTGDTRPGPFAGIEPYDEVAGLDAASVGAAAQLFERLETWWSLARSDATPVEWAARCRTLLATLFHATDDRERLTMAALQAALAAWLQACDAARFTERVPLLIVREAWLGGIDGLDASRRFMTGGVTFCTLLPLRAVPFDVVCLLGMNDGDFPRRRPPDDFDLMALPGQQRPGDRSRRDDDRYLMLEALLSARRVLYVGWSGRSARDNSVEPPSVLVSQLRDYLRAAWQGSDGDVLVERTTEHPLQPFSRRYFEGTGLTTWAREWRAAHATEAATGDVAMPPFAHLDEPLTVQTLTRFLKNPVREFFKARLGVRVWQDDAELEDHEAFEVDGREQYQLRAALIERPDELVRDGIDEALAARIERLRRSGRLPLFALGDRVIDEMTATVRPMLDRWVACHRAYPTVVARQPIHVDDLDENGDLRFDDWIDDLRSNGTEHVSIVMTPSRLYDRKGRDLRDERLVGDWVRMLAVAASGLTVESLVIGCDFTLRLRPLPADEARRRLVALASAWVDGMTRPLPFASKTALACARRGKPQPTYEGSRDNGAGEGSDFALHRLYPDYEALCEAGLETYVTSLFEPMVEWIGRCVTIETHDR